VIHRKPWFIVVCGVLIACGVWQASVPTAHAVPNFKKEFDSMYVKADSADPVEKQLAADVERVKCDVCHMPGSKKTHNAYGKALKPLLKKTDKDDLPKIHSALEKVADMKADPKDPKSPTFGDLIKQGKLPGGEPPAQPAQ
jgi:hypothetical protein